MKKICCYLIITFSLFSCKAQKSLIESKGKDIIVFDFGEDNIQNIKNEKHLTTSANTEIYNKNKIIIITQKWLGYGTGHFEKKYSFKRNKDTMNIHCKCGQEANLYIQNIRFQKGDYKLRFENETIIKGSKINVDNKLKETTFIDAYIRENNNTIFKNDLFKNLNFYEISLNSKGVIWGKLD